MKESFNWALVGTGRICNWFVKGLKVARGVGEITVASLHTENAKAFAAKHGLKKAYETVGDMLDDKDIDIVYIGTPATSHHDLTIKALMAKKAVLCEKPAALNSKELGEMIGTAGENKTFFMQALWSLFTPPFVKVKEWIDGGLIGDVRRVEANFGGFSPPNPQDRHFSLDLAGGALMEAGIYTISVASFAFGGKKPEKILSNMYIGQCGVDEKTEALLLYDDMRTASICSSLNCSLQNDAWIYGTEGIIHIPDFVFAHEAEYRTAFREKSHFISDFVGNGYNYEAEAVMDALREGRQECAAQSWEDSLKIIGIMDEIRAGGGLKFPGE
jgi:predicted dehydrogenase